MGSDMELQGPRMSGPGRLERLMAEWTPNFPGRASIDSKAGYLQQAFRGLGIPKAQNSTQNQVKCGL